MLGGISFADAKEIWALGFEPPGQTGEGDYTVLHSRDGGRTWRELRHTYQHNGAPDVSFASRRDGLIQLYDILEASPKLLVTHDGGRSWRRVSAPDDSLGQVQYLGQGQAVAYSYNIYSNAAALHTSDDLEKAWHNAPLPPGFWPDAVYFTGSSKGIVVGCLEHRPAVLATSDWGDHWSTTMFDAPTKVTDTGSGCDMQFGGAALGSHGQEWLLVQRDVFPLGVSKGFTGVWGSHDAGLSWTPVFREEDDGAPDVFVSFVGPYLIGESTVLLFKDGPKGRHSVIYSTDLGAHWSEAPLASGIGGCAQGGGGLVCAGPRFSIATVRPSASKPR
jgi:photosystem II stability/assembly factor-like uncharacterized protein